MSQPANTHHKISPTAKMVAHLRGKHTNIPHAQAVAEACEVGCVFDEIVAGIGAPGHHDWMAILVEMRFKAVDALLQQLGADKYPNVVEIAGGLSTRGFTPRLAGQTHIHTDLPGILGEFKQVAGDVLGDNTPKSLQWLEVNATKTTDFLAIEDLTVDGKVAFVNEGLLGYLTKQHQYEVAYNIHETLVLKGGGVWITPDLWSGNFLRDLAKSDPVFGELLKRITKLTDCDVEVNSFNTLEAAEKFYGAVGFKVSRFLQTDLVPAPVSKERVAYNTNTLEAATRECYIWALEPMM